MRTAAAVLPCLLVTACGDETLAPVDRETRHRSAFGCLDYETCEIVGAFDGACPQEPLESRDGVDNNCDGRGDEWDGATGRGCDDGLDYATWSV